MLIILVSWLALLAFGTFYVAVIKPRIIHRRAIRARLLTISEHRERAQRWS